MGIFMRLCSFVYHRIPFSKLKLATIYDAFFIESKFYGWGMKTVHENPWIDNYGEEIFRKSSLDVKNFIFTKDTAGIDKNSIDRLLWRHWIVTFAIRYAIKFSNNKNYNFVECGTADGVSAFFSLREISAHDKVSKNYTMYLYDSWNSMNKKTLLESESNFTDYSNLDMSITKENLKEFSKNLVFCPGYIPQSFDNYAGPSSINFLHIDLNSSVATMDTLLYFTTKLSKGGIILFDDYGSTDYSDTKEAIDKFFNKKNGVLLKFPTGQAIYFHNVDF